MINTSPRVMVLAGKGMMTSQMQVLFLCTPHSPTHPETAPPIYSFSPVQASSSPYTND